MKARLRFALLIIIFNFQLSIFNSANCQTITFVELNCENLFDCRHDTLKQDNEFCEGGARYWNFGRYWRKLNNIGREIISCGGEGEEWTKPNLIALVEVENDSVLTMLTSRALLNRAHYDYVMTNSADERGIDVALLYDPDTFTPILHYSIRPTLPSGSRPTRDILYATLLPTSYSLLPPPSPLHTFVIHAPSRSGGEKATESNRLAVVLRLCQSIDSIRATDHNAHIIVAGDFNDYHNNKSLRMLAEHGMRNISAKAKGKHGAQGTYRYQGIWDSLDHILISESLYESISTPTCEVHDAPFLIIEDTKYGGVKPRRTYNGYKYDADGFSDHLPLILRFHYR